MYGDRRVIALVPAYNEQDHIADVIKTMPGFVDQMIVVNDASTDQTKAMIESVEDERVVLIDHETNAGLGGSLVEAHIRALELGGDIMVVMAGDGQMDPQYLPSLLDPIVEDTADFTKGNRFYAPDSWRGMPRHRVFGNIVLSFMNKAATGYWDVIDPQNGYTAMSRKASERIDWSAIVRDYSFENDVLAALWIAGCRVRDIDIPAVYGTEVSTIRLGSTVPALLRTMARGMTRRFWLRYVLRSFSPVAMLIFSGLPLMVWGTAFGIWAAFASIGPAQASTGTVMLAVIPLMIGFQMVLAAFIMDVLNSAR